MCTCVHHEQVVVAHSNIDWQPQAAVFECVQKTAVGCKPVHTARASVGNKDAVVLAHRDTNRVDERVLAEPGVNTRARGSEPAHTVVPNIHREDIPPSINCNTAAAAVQRGQLDSAKRDNTRNTTIVHNASKPKIQPAQQLRWVRRANILSWKKLARL